MAKQKIILTGMPASPGRISGKVKFVNSPSELSGLSKGDIIVTSFLTPDFVSYIKKSQNNFGIITDKGGLTCHAAIVARELKIPYIAAAMSATKKLKNNDIILMDAKEGIVYGEI